MTSDEERIARVAGVGERGTGERWKGACNKYPFCSFLQMLAPTKLQLTNLHWVVNTVNSRRKSAMRKGMHYE